MAAGQIFDPLAGLRPTSPSKTPSRPSADLPQQVGEEIQRFQYERVGVWKRKSQRFQYERVGVWKRKSQRLPNNRIFV